MRRLSDNAKGGDINDPKVQAKLQERANLIAEGLSNFKERAGYNEYIETLKELNKQILLQLTRVQTMEKVVYFQSQYNLLTAIISLTEGGEA